MNKCKNTPCFYTFGASTCFLHASSLKLVYIKMLIAERRCCLVAKLLQWNLSITDTIGESQFVRYREVSLVERFDILMTIITIIVIHIHVVIIIHPL